MSPLALVLFVFAMSAAAVSIVWSGTKTPNARFISLIGLALFMLAFFCFLISWKLACPPTDSWFNSGCFSFDTLRKAF